MDNEDDDTIDIDINKVECDDCKNKFNADELKKCSGCHMKLCEICLEEHADEHYKYEDDEDEEIRY